MNTDGPFKNFTLSDVPQNDDYARGGIFSGDYSNLAIGPDGTAYASWSSQSGETAKQPPSQDVIDAFSLTPSPPRMFVTDSG